MHLLKKLYSLNYGNNVFNRHIVHRVKVINHSNTMNKFQKQWKKIEAIYIYIERGRIKWEHVQNKWTREPSKSHVIYMWRCDSPRGRVVGVYPPAFLHVNHMWFTWFSCSFKLHMFSYDPTSIYTYIYISVLVIGMGYKKIETY